MTIRAADRDASERFYGTVLPVIGIERGGAGGAFIEWGDFSIARADATRRPTHGLHTGFAAPSRAHVDDFWRAGTEAGYRSDGPPGPRPQYRDDYYGAFLLDPDGNSVEAVHHGRTGERTIDHLWIRVADVRAARRFYETIAPYAGFALAEDRGDLVRFAAATGSFSVLDGPPTRRLHLAFPAADDATVDAFHAAAIAAGYRDHGEPGERPAYHGGYYAAFVLDPDANSVEVVNHNR